MYTKMKKNYVRPMMTAVSPGDELMYDLGPHNSVGDDIQLSKELEDDEEVKKDSTTLIVSPKSVWDE